MTLGTTVAPVLPFVTEEIYRELVVAHRPDGAGPASVHLEDYPIAQPDLIDHDLEEAMSVVRQVVSMGRSLRVANDLRIRQPLSSLTVVTQDHLAAAAVEAHTELISEELNVKSVATSTDEAPLVTFHPRANFKALGAKLGERMKEVAEEIQAFDDAAVERLLAGSPVTISDIEIAPDEVIIDRRPRPGLVVAAEGPVSVALDCTLTSELEVEGLARELVNRIQALRRELGLDVADRILVQWQTGSKRLAEAFDLHAAYVSDEILAVLLEQGDNTQHEVAIGGESVKIGIEVAKTR